jgi:hypothetical protein
VLQMKLVNSLPQVNPEIFVVEHAKVFSIALKKSETVVMKRRRMNWPSQQPLRCR